MGSIELNERLKIYHISIPNEFRTWDCYDSKVVIAKNRYKAKIILSKEVGDEGSLVWLKESKMDWIGYALERMKEGIICSSFKAG